MERVTIRKLDHTGRQVITYLGEVLQRTDDSIELRTTWTRPPLDLGYVILETGGLWTERCQGCGQCILARTGGICPVSRCAKRVMNGPCGGSSDGKCEIDKELICAWQLIVERLKSLDRMADYEELSPIKDWSTDRAGGPRKVVREDVQS